MSEKHYADRFLRFRALAHTAIWHAHRDEALALMLALIQQAADQGKHVTGSHNPIREQCRRKARIHIRDKYRDEYNRIYADLTKDVPPTQRFNQRKLPPDAQLIELRSQGVPVAEIAEKYGVTAKTVATTLHRARAKTAEAASAPRRAALTSRDLEWQAYAKCRDYDPELWSPDKGEHGLQAIRICRACPVIMECRAFGDRAEAGNNKDGTHGILGGETVKERLTRRRSMAERIAS